MDAKKVGFRIQQARINAGLTQEFLAQKVNLSPKYISNLECGAKTPKLETFIAIANALQTDANSLLTDVLDCHAEIMATKLGKEIDKLSNSDKEKVFKIINVMTEK